MPKHLDNLINGVFEYDNGRLKLSEKRIELNISEGDVPTGSFQISSTSGSAEGFIVSSSVRMSLDIKRFYDEEVQVRYLFDSTGLESGASLRGEISIVSNKGEYSLPFIVNVSRNVINTSMGNVRNLFHFANLAHTDFDEAVRLFYSPAFTGVFRDSDRRFLNTYRAFSAYAGNYENVEEFLIAVRKKDPVELSLSTDELNVGAEELQEDTRRSVNLIRSGWGFVEISLSTDSDFIDLDKSKLANDDFMGNNAQLGFNILKEKLHSGVNSGAVFVRTYDKELKFDVIVKCSEGNGEETWTYVKSQKTVADLTSSFLRYRCKKINSYQWTHESIIKIQQLIEQYPEDLRYRLYHAFLQINARHEEIAIEEMQRIEMSPGYAVMTDEMKGFEIYIKAFLKHDDEYTAAEAEKIRYMRESKRSSPWLLILLIFMDERLERQPHEKLRLLEHQFEISGASPLILMESLRVLNERPEEIRSIGSFELVCARFGLKHNILSRQLSDHIVYLSGQMRRFDPLLHKILVKLYEEDKSDEILMAICLHLIRGEIRESRYSKWYETAIMRNLMITKLYEYYIYSVEKNVNTLLPSPVIMYFSMSPDLEDEYMAFFYADLITNKEKVRDTLVECNKNIVQFAVRCALNGYIDENMAIVYEYVNTLTGYSQKYAYLNAVSALVFKHKVSIADKNATRVIVIEDNFVDERSYPLYKGSAYVDVFANDYEIFYETADLRRRTLSDKDTDSVLLKNTQYKVTPGDRVTDIGTAYFICEAGRHFISITEENVNYVIQIITSEKIDPVYRSELLTELMEYYYDADDEEKLTALLRNLDPAEVTSQCRAEAVRFMVIEGMTGEAYALVQKYGSENVGAKIMVKLLNYLISESLYENEAEVISFAFTTFKGGKYDEVLLEFLSNNYQGPVKDLRHIWSAGVDFELSVEKLEERILSQMLFSRSFVGVKDDIFVHYLESGLKGDIAKAYLSFSAYEYFVKDRITDERIFDKMLESYYEGDEVNDCMMLAMTAYYASRESVPEKAVSAVVEIVKLMLRRGIYFGFFKNYAKYIPMVSVYSDRTYIEYKTNPKSRVTINYLVTSSDSGKEPNEFETEEMQNLYGGIYSKRIVMFYGETLQYYINEEAEGKSSLTVSDSIEVDDVTLANSDSKYNMINDMLNARALGDTESLNGLIDMYFKKEEAVEDLFEVMRTRDNDERS